MILLLSTLAHAETTFTVQSRDQWASAMGNAQPGDVIEIDPAIDPAELDPMVVDTKLTIRSMTSETAPIPALYVESGALTLENVQLVQLADSAGYTWANQSTSVPCSHQPTPCGIYVSSGTTLTATDLLLSDLDVGTGDAIFVYDAIVSLTDLSVQNVTAGNSIATLYPDEARTFICESCVFDASAGLSFGDEAGRSTVLLENLRFEDTPDANAVIAPVYASGLFELQVQSSRFERTGGSTAGMVAIQDVSYATISGSGEDIWSQYYGAIAAWNSKLTVQDLDLSNVTAVQGGVVFLDTGELDLSRIQVEQVSASNGALAMTTGAPLVAQDLEVRSATVTGPSGAIVQMVGASGASIDRMRACDVGADAVVAFSGNALDVRRAVVQNGSYTSALNVQAQKVTLDHSTVDSVPALLQGRVSSELVLNSNVLHNMTVGVDMSAVPSDRVELDYNLWSQVDNEQAAGLSLTQGANSVRTDPRWHPDYNGADCETWPLLHPGSAAVGTGQPDVEGLPDMGAFNEPADFKWYAWTPGAVDTGDTGDSQDPGDSGPADDTGAPQVSVPELLGGCGQVGPWGALLVLGAGLALRRRARVTLSA